MRRFVRTVQLAFYGTLVPAVAFAQRGPDEALPGEGLEDAAGTLLEALGVPGEWIAVLGAGAYLIAQASQLFNTQGLAAKGGVLGALGQVVEVVAANKGKSKSAPAE